MNISEKFEINEFNRWYNKTNKVEINIENELESLINSLTKSLFHVIKINGKEDTLWSFLKSFIYEVSVSVQSNTDGFIFDVLPEYGDGNIVEFKTNYTKPVKSIINKMWRINNYEKGLDYIHLDNIKDRVKDLVRFSIRTNSLKNSELLAQNFASISQEKKSEYKIYWDSILDAVWVDSEMKTNTGYFAYHIYFKLRVGLIIELQIYSILSESWKKLSHKIYDVVRDEINVKYNFNDIYSRIVSIGHLLYLADCELYNLEKELEDK